MIRHYFIRKITGGSVVNKVYLQPSETRHTSAKHRLALFVNYIHSNCLLCLCVTIYHIDFLPNSECCCCMCPYSILLCIFSAPPCCLLLLLLMTILRRFVFIRYLSPLFPCESPIVVANIWFGRLRLARCDRSKLRDKSILKAHLMYSKHISERKPLHRRPHLMDLKNNSNAYRLALARFEWTSIKQMNASTQTLPFCLLW